MIKGLMKLGLVVGLSTGVAYGSDLNTFNLEHEHVPDELIVKFKSTSFVPSILNKMNAQSLHTFKSNGARLIRFFTGGDEKALMKKALQLSKMPNVEYVEANTIMHISRLPNDPDFSKTYGLHNTGANGGTVDADIDAPEAWNISTGSKDVLVAVIDTGIDYTHDDIKNNYWQNPGETGIDANGNDKRTNGIDDDGNGYVDDFRGWDFVNNDNDPMDDNKHGTHCAGTIGASGNDEIGLSGVNWNVSIVGVKFLSGNGSGSLDDAVKAIEYAVTIGADLTSNSWGGGGFSETMKAAIADALKADQLFVAAAGNEGSNNDITAEYPSGYALPNVISVAATDRNDQLAGFSCYGEKTVDLAAPGVDILSTIPNGGYSLLSGTSMATPHVAGAVALVKAVYPEKSALEIKDRILKGADSIVAMSGKSTTGGRLNVYNAIEKDFIAPGKTRNVSVASAQLRSLVFDWEKAGDDLDEGEAARYEVRTSSQKIMNEADWSAAKKVKIASKIKGGGIRAVVKGLPVNYEGYFAVKAIDNVGNVGSLSKSVFGRVLESFVLSSNTADSLDGLDPEGLWNVQTISGESVFTDSPDTSSGNLNKTSLKFPSVDVASKNVGVSFDIKSDLEAGYDYMHLDFSTDNGRTWKKVYTTTGQVDWHNEFVELASYLEDGAHSIRIRYRMDTDDSMGSIGVFIDNVKIIVSGE